MNEMILQIQLALFEFMCLLLVIIVEHKASLSIKLNIKLQKSRLYLIYDFFSNSSKAHES